MCINKISRCAGHLVKKSYKKKAYIKKFSRCAGHLVKKSYKKKTYNLKNKFKVSRALHNYTLPDLDYKTRLVD